MMVRTIIIPQNNTLSLSLPDDLVGRRIEVILFAREEPKQQVAKTLLKPSQMRGFLNAATAEAMQQHVAQSRREWDTL